MQPSNPPIAIFGRAAGGLFAGAVLGLLIEAPFLQGPLDDRRILLIGPVVGSILLSIIAIWFGGRELPDWFRFVSIGFLTGIVVGAVCGLYIYPAIREAIDGYDPVFYEKIRAIYANVGVTFGVPIGGIAGILLGLAISFWMRRPALSQHSLGAERGLR